MRQAQKTTANLSERAYEQLKAMAVTYQLRPGERLAELDLAKRLKVSRTPIREALNRLVTEGFLTFTPNRGFQCRPLDAKEIFDLYEVRRSLESTAARLAVERASDDELADLERFIERSRAVSEKTHGDGAGATRRGVPRAHRRPVAQCRAAAHPAEHQRPHPLLPLDRHGERAAHDHAERTCRHARGAEVARCERTRPRR